MSKETFNAQTEKKETQIRVALFSLRPVLINEEKKGFKLITEKQYKHARVTQIAKVVVGCPIRPYQ